MTLKRHIVPPVRLIQKHRTLLSPPLSVSVPQIPFSLTQPTEDAVTSYQCLQSFFVFKVGTSVKVRLPRAPAESDDSFTFYGHSDAAFAMCRRCHLTMQGSSSEPTSSGITLCACGRSQTNRRPIRDCVTYATDRWFIQPPARYLLRAPCPFPNSFRGRPPSRLRATHHLATAGEDASQNKPCIVCSTGRTP